MQKSELARSTTLPPLSPVLESKSHPGRFFAVDPKTGGTEWLGENESVRTGSRGSVASEPQPTFSFAPHTHVHGRKDACITNQGWSDPKAKALYEKGKAAEKRMFYSPSECGECCGDDPECMCTICICGNHRCPDVLRHMPYPNLKSEYRKKYPGWDTFPDRQRPRQKGPLKAPPVPGMYDRPKPLPSEPVERVRPVGERLRPKNPFDGQTEYKDTFIPKRLDEKAQRPKDIPMEHVPFTGTSEHRDMFDGAEGSPAEPVRKSDPPLPPGDFRDATEHRDRFQGKQGDPVKRRRPQDEPFAKGQPGEHNTEYRDEYVPMTGKLCPARLLPRKKPGHDDHMHYHFTGQHNKLGDPLYHG